jgi:alkylated DNA repair dioxygenase AlkB
MGAEQLSLFGREPPALALDPGRLRRLQLDPDCWIDHASAVIVGHAWLFEALRSGTRWRQERRVMYEREVDVPRLFASLPEDGPKPRVLAELEAALAQHYAASFDHIGVALYRDGRDSVAWHRDHLPRDRPTLVAILTLGAPRRFQVRPFGGGNSRAFQLGWGDLLVMGGMCQARWEHSVPKQKSASARISCVFRHVFEALPS